MMESARFRELIRFCLSGALNTLLAYGVFSALTYLGAHYAIALTGDYLFAIFFSLIVNKRFTFKFDHAIDAFMVLRMALSYLAMYVLNAFLLFVFLDVLRINVYLAQAVASIVIAGVSFLMQRFLVFSESQNRPDQSEK